MKTAVSIPDDVFASAEDLARRLSISRSELYARALSDLIKRQQGASITECLNEVYADQSSALDPKLSAAQRRVLTSEPW